MIDWKQSLPQIIAAIIGSGLIVTAFSTITSLIFKPLIDISVGPSFLNNMNYTIHFSNIGYGSATHLRLTMSYPGANMVHTIVDQQEENMTVKNETRVLTNGYNKTSVVAFLPRLASGASISINNGISTEVGSPNVYSIIATYDQGSSDPYYYYTSKQGFVQYSYSSKLVSDLLESLALIVAAFLLIAIALRHKRRRKSKLASDILKDIMKVRNELDNSEKGDPNGIIIHLHAWHDNERQVVSDYKDYQKIDDFYSAAASRNCYLLQNEISGDILNILNKDCVNKARTAYTGIDWRKFLKLDLVLLIPALH
jgi:hypothetical protein